MNLTAHSSFQGRPGPLLIVVADGVGLAPDAPGNAVTKANTPNLDALMASGLYTELAAHGLAVGLPSDDDMGNSEVGHNALGAGRIFAQGAKLVNEAFANQSLFESEVWQAAIHHAKDHTLHLLGIHSDGNVHSHNQHLYQLIERAVDEGVQRIRLHILLDGRDVDARSALGYIETTEALLAKLRASHGADLKIASGGGRMQITMDRYEADWDMVERGYQCHAHGIGEPFSSASEAVASLYESTGKSDQYLPAFVIHEDGKPVGLMDDGDALILFNFRGDRAIEISRCFEEEDFDVFDRSQLRPHPKLYYAGMLQYDGDLLIPKNYLVNPPQIDRTMGEYLCASGLRSFAISETQKYGHVTFFWNGNRSGYLDESLEQYLEIPSDNVEFNEAPAMKAHEITAATIDFIESGKFDFGRINYANGDMVGHTGDMQAAITAIEVVDQCLGELISAIEANKGILIFTADHGNADIMFTEKDGVRTPKTSHTLNPVPFAIVDPLYQGDYHLIDRPNQGLANIAATAINLLGLNAPQDYEPSLVQFSHGER
ncbi:MAG: 2,3-bisphosphoglycerate-independent phosphoglycerate mutase [Pseudomonadota bacterium]